MYKHPLASNCQSVHSDQGENKIKNLKTSTGNFKSNERENIAKILKDQNNGCTVDT